MHPHLRTSLLFMIWGLCAALPVPLHGQAGSPRDTLEGIWESRQYSGPAVAGQLEIAQSEGGWSGRIAEFILPVTVNEGRLSLQLPGGEGRFEGRLDADSIQGFWMQPPGNANSPVMLRPLGHLVWRGMVAPMRQEWTLYLVVTRRPDGSLGAFVRNPERNRGLFWGLDRLERHDNGIKLIGKWLGRGEERVMGEGTYHPD